MKQNNKIVLTGGHAATTAMAVIESIRGDGQLKNLDIVWIGSSIAREGSNERTLESKIMPLLGVKTYSISAGKIQTKFTKYTLISLLKIPIGFVQSFFLLMSLKPKLVLSFGGYASFPVVVWAWVFRIPVVLHEQTVAAGRATLASALFATKITLARTESLKYFPKNKTVVIGNPIRKSILSVKPKNRPDSPPTLLVMGGSRGSEFINELVSLLTKNFLKNYKLIHLGGNKTNVDPDKMAQIYNQADIILSRSGANTVSEIIYIKRPSILIPLPRTFMDEQVKNADYAKEFGIAIVLSENEAIPERVEMEIEKIRKNWQKIVDGVVDKKSPDLNASEKLVDILKVYI